MGADCAAADVFRAGISISGAMVAIAYFEISTQTIDAVLPRAEIVVVALIPARAGHWIRTVYVIAATIPTFICGLIISISTIRVASACALADILITSLACGACFRHVLAGAIIA
jgi:hypothetical protein